MKSLIFFVFLLSFSAVKFANSQATQQAMTPNLYELAGGQLHVTYSTTGKDGQPYFSYENGGQKLPGMENDAHEAPGCAKNELRFFS